MHRLTRVYMALGFNTSAFAKEVGVSPNTINNWEKGADMSMNAIKVLHNKFGLSYEYLLGTGKATGNEKIDRIINLQEEIKELRKEVLG